MFTVYNNYNHSLMCAVDKEQRYSIYIYIYFFFYGNRFMQQQRSQEDSYIHKRD